MRGTWTGRGNRGPWWLTLAGAATIAVLGAACDNSPAGPALTVPDAASADRGADDEGSAKAPKVQRRYGRAVRVGHGSAHSYLDFVHGKPIELGITLSEQALDGLPTLGAGMSFEYLLPLPHGNPTQYQLVELDWNPGGHPPPMVYTVPHFDFHFYEISLAERNAIVPSDPAYAAKAANLPAVQFRTPGWFPPPGPAVDNAVPFMGLHWINPASPEFQGLGFSRTFIIGSWDGHFTFYEPMVTRAYLLGKPNDVAALPVAQSYERAGWYPGAYRVSWDAASREWNVAITQLFPIGRVHDLHDDGGDDDAH